jgi:hypothetical protein
MCLTGEGRREKKIGLGKQSSTHIGKRGQICFSTLRMILSSFYLLEISSSRSIFGLPT